MKTYYIFISHAWKYNNHYEKIVSFLDNAKNRGDIKWQDYSIPINDPVHTNGTDKQLHEAIEKQIKLSSIVLLIGGVYSTTSKWINKEIDIAKSFGKSIITIKLWDSERSSDRAQKEATSIVGWNTSAIIDAIKQHG